MLANFLPALSQADIQQAAQLIHQAYSPQSHPHISPDDQRRIQQELFDIQRRPEAWGLVIPFLENTDPNIQFFGAHTAQVKIARDWDLFPRENASQLRDLMLELTSYCILSGRNKVILRKLFVALASLALKIAPFSSSSSTSGQYQSQSQWPDWIIASVNFLSSRGAPSEHILDFLTIVAEEVKTADLIGGAKMQMSQSLIDASPMVVRAVIDSITRPRAQIGAGTHELQAALRCLQAWMSILRGDDLTSLIPLLITLLTPASSLASRPDLELDFDETIFVPASDALQELMAESSFSGGSGTSTLTDPLLVWLDTWGDKILEASLKSGFVDAVSHSLCKLVVALGDHSNTYFASHITSSALVAVPIPTAHSSAAPLAATPISAPSNPTPKPKSHLIQRFLRLILGYTALPGWYGVDEEESEMTLGFWYLLQESLWSADYDGEQEWGEHGPQDSGSGSGSRGQDGGDDRDGGTPGDHEAHEKNRWTVIRAVFGELVQVLRRKVVWPEKQALDGWGRDQVDKFQVYRRDVGDTLLNAYYILRDDMLGYYLNDIQVRLSNRREGEGWEEIEASLHCIMSVQEGVPLEDNQRLGVLFGTEVLGRLPTAGNDRIRRTTLSLLGTYSSWFTTQSTTATPTSHPTLSTSSTSPPTPSSSLLMNAVSYVVSALPEPSLCLPAANALRDLCDANRLALAPHIGAFAELHAGLGGIPDTEKSKVLQSISSVIQALPPEEEIPPVHAIVSPVVEKLTQALHSSSQLPEEARAMAIVQLQTLSGVAKGLTRTTDSLLILDETPEEQAEAERLRVAREDFRMVKLRGEVFAAVQSTTHLWSTDASVSDALSDFFRSITCLPADITILSLPAGPILELVCLACQRQLTAVWLSLASMLVVQLDPPVLFPSSTLKSGPSAEAQEIIGSALPLLLQTSLSVLGQPNVMESNPDIVQGFFSCMDTIAKHFIAAFYKLPPGALDALMQCAIGSLSLQERYSLAAACTFLSTLIRLTASSDELGDASVALVHVHGRPLMRAILCGFAGVAPRSAAPNLIELLSMVASKYPSETRTWMNDILFADDFVQSKATQDAKKAFVQAVVGSRSPKRTREAAQQFILIARGLEGSSFGYATM
ncbi:armadillo-type protein [Hygrophoropsis aurantiaca]|uniref:Armadillo-type protein n=1 Tax=Hygrophoropsis aurantiaca TaxID=72124 RepID=A0ACB7ZWC8_9AGAM|nr:armadillo-type protein [Hygrophoropsis aurantiaca]